VVQLAGISVVVVVQLGGIPVVVQLAGISVGYQ